MPGYFLTISLAITVYLGLAVYVITRSPRRAISWVFGLIFLAFAGSYITSFFLVPGEVQPVSTPLPLRIKWVLGSFGPALFLHLASFYFPRTFRHKRLWLLLPFYTLGIGLAWTALFTNLLVAGPLHRPPPNIIGPSPGPLMPYLAGSFILAVLIGFTGLYAGYKAALSPYLRLQIIYLLAPVVATVVGVLMSLGIVLAKVKVGLLFSIVDILQILAAIFTAYAVLHYGSFLGRPLTWRNLAYTILGIFVTLLILFVAFTIDHQLSLYTVFPYPIVSGILIIILIAGFPIYQQNVTGWLDALFYHSEKRQHNLEYYQYLSEQFANVPDVQSMLTELLGTLCSATNVQGGFLGVSKPSSLEKDLEVKVVWGNVGVKPGDKISPAPTNNKEPQLATALTSREQENPGWEKVAIFSHLSTPEGATGLLALGERRDGKTFRPQDLALCKAMARQFEAVIRLINFREQHNQQLESVQIQDQAIRQMEEQVIVSTFRTLRLLEGSVTPLEVHLLGSMQVKVDGRKLSESAWGSERAKAMLAYLLWKGTDGASRGEITLALWPDLLDDKAANVFHVTVNRLRQALEPDLERARDSQYILHDRGKYRFSFEAPHWMDVGEFRELATSEDVAALQHAVSLYRGSYLEDEAWGLPPDVEVERRVFERLYEDVLRKLIALGGDREAEIYLEKLLMVDPGDEDARAALIQRHLAHGRKDLARDHVARWQRELEELGLPPTPEVKALWQRVLYE